MRCPNCGHELESPWPEECQEQVCDYYTQYLRYSKPGQPDIPHAAFHVAARQCEAWQKIAESYLERGQDIPPHVERFCRRYEEEIRA